MIDFLNLSEEKDKCRDCAKMAHSLHLIPYDFNPYVFYVGYPEYFIENVILIDAYGNEIVIYEDHNEQTIEYFSLSNIMYDDVNNVVLKVSMYHNDTLEYKRLYSDPLKISSKNSCKTTRVHFKCKDTDVMQSLSFPFWFWHEKRALELESYYQISTKSQVSYAKSNAKYKRYNTSLMNIDTLNKLNDALSLPYVYFNFKRVCLFEPIEIPDLTADEYFAETNIYVSEFKGIGDNELDSNVYLATENGDNLITENNNNIIIE